MLYSPDKAFIRNLKALNRDLSARWDPAMQRWIIYYKNKQVWVVKKPDGSYMPLDNRTLAEVALSDSQRFGGAKGLIQHLRLDDEKREMQNRKAWRDMFKDIHADALPFMRNRKSVS